MVMAIHINYNKKYEATIPLGNSGLHDIKVSKRPRVKESRNHKETKELSFN